MLVSSGMAKSLWKDDYNPYSEHKARGIGDIVTINISESASATQDATTTNSENSNNNATAGTGFMSFLPLGTSKTSTGYNGSGKTTRSNKFTTTITARITEILGNGIYKIIGKRELNLNNETETITVSGIIRDQDISRDNYIDSTKIAEAKILYSGKGVVADSQKPGLITRILQSIF